MSDKYSMRFSYFESDVVTAEGVARTAKKLATYRKHVEQVIEEKDSSQPEYSLAHAADQGLHDTLDTIKQQFKGIQHLILIGIGGSNLGTEAVHRVLNTGGVTLHTLDTISAHEISRLLETLQSVKSVKKLAVCVISKSGNTAETLVNAGVLLAALEKRYQKSIYAQTLFIGNSGTPFMQAGKRLGVTTVSMPDVVGGRYSVATEVGLVPLALLGHDTDAYVSGVLDASAESFESVVAEQAARVYQYAQKGYRHYNFFAFETRLETLGAWYRQLTAESLGKEHDRAGKPVTKAFLPTISTPVELHSIGQLYLSGFPGVYTDFVTFDDDTVDFSIPKKSITKQYGAYSVQDVSTALYGGVVAAYQERSLPYRSVIFDDENLAYSLGLFMGMRMRETMYVAELMNVNAFDQPNVELYKEKTRDILGL